ncbi:hypothetical protein S83_045422 [Arachis hypogaea]
MSPAIADDVAINYNDEAFITNSMGKYILKIIVDVLRSSLNLSSSTTNIPVAVRIDGEKRKKRRRRILES